MRMSFQSASSSSATACASAVPTCWPISDLVMCTVMMPPRSIVYHTVGEKLPAASASPAPPMSVGSSEKPQVSPAPVAMLPTRNWRRFTRPAVALRANVSVMSDLLGPAAHVLGGAFDGFLDPHISHAAAEIAVHRLDDLRIARVGVPLQQRRRLHDLPRLAPAALRHLLGDPGPLQRMLAARVEPFDRRHLALGRIGQTGLAGAHGLAAQVNRARAAQARAAAEFRAGHLQMLAHDPEKRRVVRHVDDAPEAVDGQDPHGIPSFAPAIRSDRRLGAERLRWRSRPPGSSSEHDHEPCEVGATAARLADSG